MDAIPVNINSPLCIRTAALSVPEAGWVVPDTILDGYYLLFFVRQGTLHVNVDSDDYVLDQGQTLLLRPGQHMAGAEPLDGTLQYYWLQFAPDEPLSNDSRDIIRVPLMTQSARPTRLVELFRMLLDDQQAAVFKLRSSHQIFAAIICEVADAEALRGKAGNTAVRLADRARNYIRTHIQQPLTTTSVAAALDCNPGYLARTFSAVFEMTVAEYTKSLRLFMARQMLLESDKPISQIARECGFSDMSYFGRVFRESEGASASDFRRLYARHYTVSR